jgi:hypothetical protein
MKIRYLTGARSGQTDHVPHSQEIQVLINAGIIEAIPYASYRERLAEEGQGMQQQPDPNFVQGIQYSVRERQFGSVNTGHAFIERRSGSETLFFDTLETIPADCPKNIIVRFLELNKVGDPEVLAEKRIQEQYRQEAAARKQRETETAAAVKKFGWGVLRDK